MVTWSLDSSLRPINYQRRFYLNHVIKNGYVTSFLLCIAFSQNNEISPKPKNRIFL